MTPDQNDQLGTPESPRQVVARFKQFTLEPVHHERPFPGMETWRDDVKRLYRDPNEEDRFILENHLDDPFIQHLYGQRDITEDLERAYGKRSNRIDLIRAFLKVAEAHYNLSSFLDWDPRYFEAIVNFK